MSEPKAPAFRPAFEIRATRDLYCYSYGRTEWEADPGTGDMVLVSFTRETFDPPLKIPATTPA